MKFIRLFVISLMRDFKRASIAYSLNNKASTFVEAIAFFFGREDRIRTCDPLVPNQVRYRPALLPVPITICIVNIVNRYKIQDKNLRAERKGFEPLVQFNPYGSLANY